MLFNSIFSIENFLIRSVFVNHSTPEVLLKVDMPISSQGVVLVINYIEI
jgi:hypothetical protein